MLKRIGNFEKNSIILMIFTLLASLCNYLFQVAIGNLLTAAEFGTVNTLLSLMNIVSVPTGMFLVLASRYATYYLSTENPSAASSFLYKLEKVSVLCAIATLLIGVLFSSFIATVLRIDNRWYILTSFVIVAISYVGPVFTGALQGSKKFVSYGLVSVLISVGKLVCGILFIILGARVIGPLFALLVGNVISIAFAIYCLRDLLSMPRHEQTISLRNDLKGYISGAFFIQLGNTLLNSGDILLVKSLFTDPTVSGLYSSGMVIGKIPLYVVGTLVAVLFPMVSELSAKRQDTRPLFAKALIYSTIITVGFVIFLQFFGVSLLSFMFGEQYLHAFELLLPIGAFILTVTLITVEINYFLAIGKTKLLAYSLFIGIAALIGLAICFHETLSQMLYIMSGVLMMVFLINAISGLLFKSNNVSSGRL